MLDRVLCVRDYAAPLGLPAGVLPMVGGRLRFLPAWHLTTSHQWVLDVISGVSHSFYSPLPSSLGLARRQSVGRCSRPVPEGYCSSCPGGMGSGDLFDHLSGSEAHRGFWIVINLRPLNKFVWKIPFKMETLQRVIPLIQEGWVIFTLDLQDAQPHVPVALEDQWFL